MVLLACLFKKTNYIGYVHAMLEEIEYAHPDLKFGPGTSTDGTLAF